MNQKNEDLSGMLNELNQATDEIREAAVDNTVQFFPFRRLLAVEAMKTFISVHKLTVPHEILAQQSWKMADAMLRAEHEKQTEMDDGKFTQAQSNARILAERGRELGPSDLQAPDGHSD